MTRGILIALVLSLSLVVSAAASPPMMAKGQKSLAFEADSDSPMIIFGWNMAEMTKFNIGAGVMNVEPSQVVVDGQPEPSVDSNTSWQFQTGISRYLGSISNNVFAPYFGAQMNISDAGESWDMSYGVRGYFGVEAFVVESLSIGGNIGVEYFQEGDRATMEQGQPATIVGGSSITTSSSAILATLYW
jgi:hypothetical protein